MREFDWEYGGRPEEMVRFIGSVLAGWSVGQGDWAAVAPEWHLFVSPTGRQLRLAAAACCRMNLAHARDPVAAELVDLGERIAEGHDTAAAERDLGGRRTLRSGGDIDEACGWLCVRNVDDRVVLEMAAVQACGRGPSWEPDRHAAACFLREVFGNPWQPYYANVWRCPWCGHVLHLGAAPDCAAAADPAAALARFGHGCPRCRTTLFAPPRLADSWRLGRVLDAAWVTDAVAGMAAAAYRERTPCVGGCVAQVRPRPARALEGSWEPPRVPDVYYQSGGVVCAACGGSGCAPTGALASDRLAVIADALEEAGCPPRVPCPTCADWPPDDRPVCWDCGGRRSVANRLLVHLRADLGDPEQPGGWQLLGGAPRNHVRGCWALDLVLDTARLLGRLR